MCGIAGILRVHPPGEPAPPPWDSIPEPWLDILDDSIKHRGPDGAGRFRDRATRADGSIVDVALVHRRLSIIDLKDGHQPMVSLAKGAGVLPVKTRAALGAGLGLYEPGDYECLRTATVRERTASESDLVAVIFNGCIYNHRELRKELLAAGHVFSTDHSDTEVLVHGWLEWGAELPARLDGMFALAIWDARTARTFIARDTCGEKTVYYTDEVGRTDGIAFATAAAALLRAIPAMRGTPVDLDAGLVASWIHMGFGAGTPSWDVQEVAPGQGKLFGAAGAFYANPETSWPVFGTDPPEHAPDPLTPEHAESLLRQSVESRLEADVPLGCFLSSGLDSSLVSCFAQDALRRHGATLGTFTVRMPDPKLDESDAAAAVARHLGTNHTVLDCRPTPADDLLRLIPQLGTPLGDSSLLPTHWVSRAAREHVRVALSGDGGDELFCGYDRHRADRWLKRFPALVRRIPSSLLPRRNPRSRSDKLARLAAAARHSGYPDLVAIFPNDDLARLLPGLEPRPASVQPRTPEIGGGRWFDFSIYLPEDLLRKVDGASMSVPLEVRAPILSGALSRACLATPVDVLMPHGQRKGLLRQVARKYFPPEIVDRPKMGFAIPVGEWFRSNYGSMRDLLLDHLNSAEPFGPASLGIDLNMNFIKQMLKEHDDAGAKSAFPWKGRDHSQRLYMLLVLSIWSKWLGGLSSNPLGSSR